MNNLKSRLLSTLISPHQVNLLGTKVFIRSLSASELSDFEIVFSDDSKPKSTREMMTAACSMVLTALVNEDGGTVPDLPTPDELMKAHTYPDIIEAMAIVQRFSYGTLDDAKKN